MKKLLLVCALALVPGLSLAATPSEGVVAEIRRGFFVETDVGVFFTLGGNNAYSNAQTFLQLGAGYDVTEAFEVGAHFAIGSSADNCFGTEGLLGCEDADNFTLTFLDVSAAYRFTLLPRFTVAPKVVLGWTFLDPAPTRDSGNNPVEGGFNVGGGASVEYATSMEHFSVGADLLVRFVVGPNIPAVSIFPRVKYTF